MSPLPSDSAETMSCLDGEEDFMQLWGWIAAWLAINVIYLVVAIRRARPGRNPPAGGASDAMIEGRAADPNTAD